MLWWLQGLVQLRIRKDVLDVDTQYHPVIHLRLRRIMTQHTKEYVDCADIAQHKTIL